MAATGERHLTFVMQIGFLACKCMIKMISFNAGRQTTDLVLASSSCRFHTGDDAGCVQG